MKALDPDTAEDMFRSNCPDCSEEFIYGPESVDVDIECPKCGKISIPWQRRSSVGFDRDCRSGGIHSIWSSNPRELKLISHDIWFPPLPPFGIEEQAPFIPDPRKFTCTCPDWIDNRSPLPEDHPGRCCDHLRKVISNIKPFSDLPDYVQLFATRAHRPDPTEDWCDVLAGTERLLVSIPTSGIAYAYPLPPDEKDSPYQFDVDKSRWISESVPSAPEFLEEEILFRSRRMKRDIPVRRTTSGGED